MGLLLMGCLMLTIGAYPALYSGGANETRLSIGATCIAFWFISFLYILLYHFFNNLPISYFHNDVKNR